MKHKTSILALALSAPALASPQVHETSTPLASFDDIPWPLFDQPDEGPTWALGKTWKMSFGETGSTYFPRLGDDATRHTPLGFRIASATVGGEALELEPPSTPRVIGSVVEIDHGDLIERWILGPDSAEQTFVVEALPRRGELAITLDLETELVPVAEGGGWRFEGPFGDVEYGAVTAIGGSGARTPGGSRIDGDRLELTVPAHFVEEASLPLTIDPILSTGTIATSTTHSFSHTNTTYSGAHDRYVVVCEAYFNTIDNDVFALEVAGSGSLLSTTFHAIDVSTDSWSRPSCVCLESAGLVYFAAARFSSSALISSLGVRVLNLNSGTTGNQLIYDGAFGAIGSIDMGADPDVNVVGQSQNAVVVYTRYSSHSGQSVVRAMNLNLGSPIRTIATATQPDLVNSVSISPRSGRLQAQNQLRFLVAWNQRPGASQPREIAYTRLDSDSATTIGATSVITSAFELGRPDVSEYGIYQGRARAGIAYTSTSPTTDDDVQLAIIEDGAAPLISPVTSMEGLDTDHAQSSPVVAATGEHFTVAYLQSDPNQPGSREHLYWASGGLAGGGYLGLGERRVHVNTNSMDAEDPSLALKRLGGAVNHGEGLLAWASRGNVYGARVERINVQVAGWQYCTARANSTGEPGWMRVVGRPSPTTPTLRLEAYDLPTGSFGYFLCARGIGFVPLVGGSSGNLCLSGSHFGRFALNIQQTTSHGRLVTIADPRALPQSIGTIAAQSGETWCFQAWHRDHNHGGVTSNLSNAVAVTFD